MRLYNIYNINYPLYTGNNSSVRNNIDSENNTNVNTYNKETYTTWRFDEFGNIVYYTIDSKTGEIISKEIYKNPVGNLQFNIGNNNN